MNELKSIEIKGKPYVMVNERIKAFRQDYPNLALVSEIVQLDADSCIIKASVVDENGRVLATGLAQEDRTSSAINRTSFVENCETSAWGRALGNLGIGIDVSIASAEEMEIAVAKQEKMKEQEKATKLLGGTLMLNSGKYQGQRILDVIKSGDIDYLKYLLSNDKVSDSIKDNIRLAFAENGIVDEVEI